MKWSVKIPRCKRKFERNSLTYRGAKLFNHLIESNILSPNFDQLSDFSYINLVLRFRDNFILSNIQLTKTVFSLLNSRVRIWGFFLFVRKLSLNALTCSCRGSLKGSKMSKVENLKIPLTLLRIWAFNF